MWTLKRSSSIKFLLSSETVFFMNSFFLLINKPVGMTSQQCLSGLKKKFGFKKLGHHGTLDPFASGLLLVGVEEATKFFQFVDDACKTYQATLKLGERTDTMDLTGSVIEEKLIPQIDKNRIQAVLKSLTGLILQTPPMYSAIKRDGVPLYKLARRGETVERKPREIEIKELKLLRFDGVILEFEARVSRGTYIRVLGEQIAEKLATVGHLSELCRTGLVQKSLESASDIESCRPKPIPIWQMLSHLPEVQLEPLLAEKFCKGNTVPFFEGKKITGTCLVFWKQQFLGVGETVPENQIKPLRLMRIQKT